MDALYPLWVWVCVYACRMSLITVTEPDWGFHQYAAPSHAAEERGCRNSDTGSKLLTCNWQNLRPAKSLWFPFHLPTKFPTMTTFNKKKGEKGNLSIASKANIWDYLVAVIRLLVFSDYCFTFIKECLCYTKMFERYKSQFASSQS